MPSRAQLSQERSRQRRDQLLTAAIELFAEGGSRAVTHRAVARRAGLPAATTTYYFESIDDLLREALAEHLGRWQAEMDLVMGAQDESSVELDVSNLLGTIRFVFQHRSPDVSALQLAIYMAATRDESLRSSASVSLKRFEELAERWLSIAGVPDPGAVAGPVTATIIGTTMRRQSGLYADDDEAVILERALTGLLAAHLLGRDEVHSTIARSLG